MDRTRTPPGDGGGGRRRLPARAGGRDRRRHGGGGRPLVGPPRGSPDLSVIGLDRDEDALTEASVATARFGDRVTLVHARFDTLADVVRGLGHERVAGVLFDLGVSSMQLDRPDRGFSYRGDGPLDMRMDRSQPVLRGRRGQRLRRSSRLAELIARFGGETLRRPHRPGHRRRPAPVDHGRAGRAWSATPSPRPPAAGAATPPGARSRPSASRSTPSWPSSPGPSTRPSTCWFPAGGSPSWPTTRARTGMVKETLRRPPPPAAAPARPGCPACCGAVPDVRLLWRGAHKPTAAEVAANRRAESARLRAVEKLEETRMTATRTPPSRAPRPAPSPGPAAGRARPDACRRPDPWPPRPGPAPPPLAVAGSPAVRHGARPGRSPASRPAARRGVGPPAVRQRPAAAPSPSSRRPARSRPPPASAGVDPAGPAPPPRRPPPGRRRPAGRGHGRGQPQPQPQPRPSPARRRTPLRIVAPPDPEARPAVAGGWSSAPSSAWPAPACSPSSACGSSWPRARRPVDRLEAQVTAAQAENQRLRLDVARLESPARIVAEAQARLGMVPPPAVVYLPPLPPTAARPAARPSPAGRLARRRPG